MFVRRADISRDTDNASEQTASLPIQLAHLSLDGGAAQDSTQVSTVSIIPTRRHLCVTATGKLFQMRMDHICVEVPALFSSWA